MTDEIELPKLKCLRCGYEWIPRRPKKPKYCARCNSPYWDKQKWKGVKALPANSLWENAQMVRHSSGYRAVMELSKCREYEFGGIKSDWLDVVHACYLKQIELGQNKEWDANSVTGILRRIRPGHSYFASLTRLKEYDILKVKHIPKGVMGKTEPWYKMVDTNGVALALKELKYLE